MNNEVLVNIYSDDLTDAETESLFSTPKDSKKGKRRKIDYKKAKRKARIDLARSCDGLPLYDNLHQYSKNKIHCSCQLCRGKDCFGRHVTTEQEVKSHDEMLVELKELDENLLAKMREQLKARIITLTLDMEASCASALKSQSWQRQTFLNITKNL